MWSGLQSNPLKTETTAQYIIALAPCVSICGSEAPFLSVRFN